MQLGPNMKRLQETDVARSVTVCVVAGPGDLMAWEVSARVDSDGIDLGVVGRGSDLEAAAAAAMAVLTQNGSTLDPSVASDGSPPPNVYSLPSAEAGDSKLA
jgi:hypothetical protein